MRTILFLLLFCLSTVAFASTPKHFVFLIHGIGSTPTCFGQMQASLQEQAASLDPHTDWRIINFSYETGSATKDVVIFSQELSDFIALKFKEAGGLNPEDKFSLVMHSQGGLIGFNFLYRAFRGEFSYHPELPEHLDAFISLATPYWGSKIAIFANRMMPFLSYLGIPLSDKFGTEELTDMELASDFSAYFREIFTNEENAPILEKMKNQIRFLVFSGITEKLNILAPFSTGKSRYEDDTAVPIPSSHMDFLHYADSAEKHSEVVSSEDFKTTSMVEPENYIVVNAFHTSPFPQNPKFPGIAKVPDRCLHKSYRDCDHPTYPTIVEHLFKLQREEPFVRDLTSFAIDMKVKFEGKVIDRKKLTLSFKGLSTGLKIGKDTELYNKVSRWTEEGDFRLYHTGYIDSKKTTTRTGRVQLGVSLPGFKERTLVVPVKTAQSTFIELDLEKSE
jgi:hypothetical protein